MIDPETDRLVLVVVGAHLRAEMHDRPAAYRLRDDLAAAIAACWGRDHPSDPDCPRVVVISDLWRLNDPSLAPLPQVCVGHPEVNALSAFLADKVPPAFVIDGELAVQFDAAVPEAIALCWGSDHTGTARATEEFGRRYLTSFAEAVVRELGD